jgi:CRISPR type IV-associated protein Csf3
MINNLKITFNLDGTGVYYHPYEPIHLDALMAWALMPFHRQKGSEAPSRNEEPFDVPLPLSKWNIEGYWGWKASALFPEGMTAESLQYWRKKFRQNKIEITRGSPNLQNGVYREYNTPLPLLLCHKMVAYAVGDKKTVRQLLQRHVKYIGKKNAYGKGKVISVECEIVDYDWSMIKDGEPTRWLPDKNGTRDVRVRPPYWNNVDKVKCLEIHCEAWMPSNTINQANFT